MSIKNDLAKTRGLRPKFTGLAKGEASSDPRIIEKQLNALRQWRARALGEARAILGTRAVRDNLVPGRVAIKPTWTVAASERGAFKVDAEKTLSETAKADLDIALLSARKYDWQAAHDNAKVASQKLGTASSQAIGLRILSRYLLDGNSKSVRKELNDAIKAGVKSSGLITLQARLLVMVGQYGNAWNLLQGLSDLTIEAKDISEIVAPDKGKPWLQFPCNYYTYRHTLIDIDRAQRIRDQNISALSEADALRIERILVFHAAWNEGNALMDRRRYNRAISAYKNALTIANEFLRLDLHSQSIGAVINPNPAIKTFFRDRYKVLTLNELYRFDWLRPYASPNPFQPYLRAVDLADHEGIWKDKWQEKVACPILVISTLLIPLAIAEAAKALRQYGDSDEITGRGVNHGALASVRRAIKAHENHKMMSQFIEIPFSAMLKAQILIEKGDAQYRSRQPDPSPQSSTDENGNTIILYQGLKAARSYQGAIESLTTFGQYVNRSRTGITKLKSRINKLTVGDARPKSYHGVVSKLDSLLIDEGAAQKFETATLAEKKEFRAIGRQPQIPTVTFQDLISANAVWLPPLSIAWPQGSANAGDSLSEKNPQIYALTYNAMSRLQQLAAGFNFLGYSDGYVPPWRFNYLLERARYFAQHTRQIQSNYLNFLSSAENEELSETQARQTVELELANVVMETARLSQAQLESESAVASFELADLSHANAEQRVDNYRRFDENMDGLQNQYLWAAGFEAAFSGGAATIGLAISGAGLGATIGGAAAGYFSLGTAAAGGAVLGGVGGGLVVGGIAGLVTGGGASISQFAQKKIQMDMQSEQRDLEQRNLRLAIGEALGQKHVAEAQLAVANAGVEVAAASRTVALMRQEFARQTMEFLQNRTTNAELWYRLAEQIRYISDRYLKYAIELAFLAEQAYEFETGDRLDVIRFDYGIGDTGDYLAGDFLLTDLDMLEHQYIVNVRQRQQQIRFVIPLARDYPDVLEQLRQNSSAVLHLNLQALEQRFPGIFNARVSSVEIQPLALMDPSRFSMQVTHLGSGIIRTEAGASGNDYFSDVTIETWCPEADATFPARVQVSQPRTEVITGMTRQQAIQESPDIYPDQRAGFEGLATASSWYIDFSLKENRINPETLADVVISFNLTAYHNESLKTTIATHIPQESVQTLHLSGKNWYPDSYYEFHRSGQMNWEIGDFHVPTGLLAGRLRNLGLRLLFSENRTMSGRLSSAMRVDFTVLANGTIQFHSPVPHVNVQISHLTISVTVAWEGNPTDVFAKFSDENEWQAEPADGSAITHSFSQSGAYTMHLRCTNNGQLHEFTYSIHVSSNIDVTPCMTTYPQLEVVNANSTSAKLRVRHRGTESGASTMHWNIGSQRGYAASQATVDAIEVGKRYTLKFISIRNLQFRLWCGQRYKPDAVLSLGSLYSVSNRQFDDSGQLQSTGADLAGNELSTHLYLQQSEISVLDNWHVQINAQDNDYLKVDELGGEPVVDLSEIGDVVLMAEYDARSTY